MSPTFVLASSSQLPPAPSLNLLPFSLGSTSKAYSSTSAPIGTYFQPRPAPAGVPGVEPGTPIAAFRGRQLAGQTVLVPRGYRGIVIAADRPEIVKYTTNQDLGQDDEGQGVQAGRRTRTRRDQWPLTPAASTTSIGASSSSVTVLDGEEDEGCEMRRSPRKNGFARLKQRVKGAGQVALSKPVRGAIKAGKKRYRLDSSDEEENEEGGNRGVNRDVSPSPSAILVQSDTITTVTIAEIADMEPSAIHESLPPISTPTKRARPALSTPTRQSPRLATANPRTPAASARKPGLPSITLQEATPLKSPLPPPPAYLKRKRNKADYIIPGSPGSREVLEDLEEEDKMLVRRRTPESPGFKAEEEDEGMAVKLEENTMIPSPATEDDPPAFEIPTPATEEPINRKDEIPPNRPADLDIKLDIDGPIRVLRPIATFDSITLWTPDGPIPGYKSPSANVTKDETGITNEVKPMMDGEQGSSASNGDTEDEKDAEVQEEAEDGVKVRQGWWAHGGSGEGGDEVVRAMGEWLGLVEMLNEPVYLDTLSKEDDEDDENE